MSRASEPQKPKDWPLCAADKVCPYCKAPPGWHWWCKRLYRDETAAPVAEPGERGEGTET